ncbi:hypothetical protein [Streptomyces sp. NPDC050564]|uniref:hypothetical protein n=1 Tax=Streptomyces sp. NPDC050564 TaxID=3365631 RepID=UPI0037B8B3EE
MNRPSCLLASALTAGMLLSTAACSSGDSGDSGRTDVPASPAAKDSPTALTEAQAMAALITNTDLGSEWTETQGTATWHDTLLKSKVDTQAFVTDKQNAVDCQKLLDGLYAEDLLGDPKGGQAVTGFDDSDNDGQMHYLVAGYTQSDVDAKLSWLKTLPDKCDQFTAVDNKGGKQTVQVISMSLPNVGDARQGLQITMNGELDGDPSSLTLDFAAVRVGDSALSFSNGGLNGADDASTQQAAQAGATRLKDVLAGKTPPPTQG